MVQRLLVLAATALLMAALGTQALEDDGQALAASSDALLSSEEPTEPPPITTPPLPEGSLGLRPSVPTPPALPGAYRFVSAPDFLNQDVGDVRELGVTPVVDEFGLEVNSTNQWYAAALDQVLSEMRAQGANDFLSAGDLVGGRWGRSLNPVRYFGPTTNDRQRSAAYVRAANLYYPAWNRMVRSHGFRPWVTVGDHDLGDNPWRRYAKSPWMRFKYKNLPQAKRLFRAHLLGHTAGLSRPARGQGRHASYAVRLHPDVLLVSLDVFTRDQRQVRARVDAPTLNWLKRVLARAKQQDVPWVIVQGHTPVVEPVRVRYSSNLRYTGGARSALWKTMVKGGVDLYFAGEVHDQSLVVRDGVAQVAHGSLFYQGEASYLVGQVTRDRLILANHQFRGQDFWKLGGVWATEGMVGGRVLEYYGDSFVSGVIEASRAPSGRIRVDRTSGVFDPLPRG
ncbi:MAG: metallophosphoesterase [Nocardioides sp.]|nr:metallophosphoesterase [Nocardioides sp.]